MGCLALQWSKSILKSKVRGCHTWLHNNLLPIKCVQIDTISVAVASLGWCSSPSSSPPCLSMSIHHDRNGEGTSFKHLTCSSTCLLMVWCDGSLLGMPASPSFRASYSVCVQITAVECHSGVLPGQIRQR